MESEKERRRAEAIARQAELGVTVTPEGIERAKARLEAAAAKHTPENRRRWLAAAGLTEEDLE